jgi:hypothetical protein
VPTAAPTNVGQPYAETVIAPLETAGVPLGVLPPLLPPSAADGSVATDQDVAVTATLAGSDVASCDLAFDVVASPAHGTLGAIADAPCALGLPSTDTASVVYSPSAGFSGDDTFTYRVTDALNRSADATIRVTVKAAPPPLCANGPVGGCRRGHGGILKVKNATLDSSDRLGWKWSLGPDTSMQDFASPLTTTGYQLCVYDAAGHTVARASAPPGGDCGGRPCWRATTSQLVYKSRDRQPDGRRRSTVRLKLRPGVGGRAKLQLDGRGVHLDLQPLPLAQAVTVQLKNADGTCWESVYGAPALRDDASQFRDKPD